MNAVLPDGLLPLRLPDLRLLVSLGQDVGQRGAHHGALELLRLLRALLSSLLLDALAVLPEVKKGKIMMRCPKISLIQATKFTGWHFESQNSFLLIKCSPAVEDCPGHLARVPLQEVRLVAAPVDELEGLQNGEAYSSILNN